MNMAATNPHQRQDHVMTMMSSPPCKEIPMRTNSSFALLIFMVLAVYGYDPGRGLIARRGGPE